MTARRLCPEDAETAAWLALLRAVAARDAPAMGAAAERLLALAPGPLHEEHARLLAGAALAGGRSRGEVLAHWPAETRAALADFPEARLFHALGGARAVRPVAPPRARPGRPGETPVSGSG